MNKIPFFKKSDLLIIGIFLLIALVIFLPTLADSEKALTAVITADGETFTECDICLYKNGLINVKKHRLKDVL